MVQLISSLKSLIILVLFKFNKNLFISNFCLLISMLMSSSMFLLQCIPRAKHQKQLQIKPTVMFGKTLKINYNSSTAVKVEEHSTLPTVIYSFKNYCAGINVLHVPE